MMFGTASICFQWVCRSVIWMVRRQEEDEKNVGGRFVLKITDCVLVAKRCMREVDYLENARMFAKLPPHFAHNLLQTRLHVDDANRDATE